MFRFWRRESQSLLSLFERALHPYRRSVKIAVTKLEGEEFAAPHSSRQCCEYDGMERMAVEPSQYRYDLFFVENLDLFLLDLGWTNDACGVAAERLTLDSALKGLMERSMRMSDSAR
jgi:hypothetical protein